MEFNINSHSDVEDEDKIKSLQTSDPRALLEAKITTEIIKKGEVTAERFKQLKDEVERRIEKEINA